LKPAFPGDTYHPVGVGSKTKMAAWEIDIEKAGTPLRPNQSIVILSNTSGSTKEMSAVDSTNCLAARQTVTVQNGGTARLMISTADTTTIVLRRTYCTSSFIWCWQHDWVDFAVFDAAAFWDFFGGRQVTIKWFYSINE